MGAAVKTVVNQISSVILLIWETDHGHADASLRLPEFGKDDGVSVPGSLEERWRCGEESGLGCTARSRGAAVFGQSGIAF